MFGLFLRRVLLCCFDCPAGPVDQYQYSGDFWPRVVGWRIGNEYRVLFGSDWSDAHYVALDSLKLLIVLLSSSPVC